MTSERRHNSQRENRYDFDLDELADLCWELLERGADDPADPFHTAALATCDGGHPRSRTVILRSVDPRQRLIRCYTDARSTKVAELRACPFASWLFYDPERRIQLRLFGRVTLHQEDAVARRAWEALPPQGRWYYCGSPPGEPVEARRSGSEPSPGGETSEAGAESGRPNFAVIACEVEQMEWLDLNPPGHRRARFTRRDGTFAGSRVIP